MYITSRDPVEISSVDLVYTDNISEDTYRAQNGTYVLSTNRILRGRYVHIVLEKDNIHLIICEVEVYGMYDFYNEYIKNIPLSAEQFDVILSGHYVLIMCILCFCHYTLNENKIICSSPLVNKRTLQEREAIHIFS